MKDTAYCRYCGRKFRPNQIACCGRKQRVCEAAPPACETHPAIIGPALLERPEMLSLPPEADIPPVNSGGAQGRTTYLCERCHRTTFQPLNDDGECAKCREREPDPTPEELAAECAAIRETWGPLDWQSQYGAPRGWRPPVSRYNESKGPS